MIVLLLCCRLFFPATLSAQDSLPQGVVTVKRQPVPAAYTTKITYDYSKSRDKKRFWEGRMRTFRRGYQAWLSNPFPPQPVSVAHRPGDSVNVSSDSAMMASYAAHSDRPEKFDFAKYVEAIGYQFAWTDSVKLDSARFEYVVDAKGRVKFTPLPWAQCDSTTRAFEAQALPVMRKLWLWYPAQRLSNRNSKLENVACTITITVYAFDGGAEVPPPILVKQSDGD